MFSGSLNELTKNIIVGGFLMLVGAGGTWLLALERSSADTRVEFADSRTAIAETYATKKDVDDLKAYIEIQFNRIERMFDRVPRSTTNNE